MTIQANPNQFDIGKFGVGQSVPRKEDPALVRGEGRYTDDLAAEGQIYLAMVRSPVAHGILRSVDVKPALAMDGVLGAWTGEDLKKAGYGQLSHHDQAAEPRRLAVPRSRAICDAD